MKLSYISCLSAISSATFLRPISYSMPIDDFAYGISGWCSYVFVWNYGSPSVSYLFSVCNRRRNWLSMEFLNMKNCSIGSVYILYKHTSKPSYLCLYGIQNIIQPYRVFIVCTSSEIRPYWTCLRCTNQDSILVISYSLYIVVQPHASFVFCTKLRFDLNMFL